MTYQQDDLGLEMADVLFDLADTHIEPIACKKVYSTIYTTRSVGGCAHLPYLYLLSP